MATTTRYFAFLSFRGTSYNGWQFQPGKHTVQGIANKALSTLLSEAINVTGAGRTDTGVHASFFCAHFDTKRDNLDSDRQFLHNINGFLPSDIAISKFVKVRDNANARFDALSRTYQYTIATVKDPFFSDNSWLLFWKLDVDLLNKASAILLNHNDFTSFSRLHGGNKTNLCRVMSASWEAQPGKLIFTIKADRFLRNMVRAITGTLIPVGTGKLGLKEFEAIIEGRNRGLAGQSAPAQGLSLINIEYPAEIFI